MTEEQFRESALKMPESEEGAHMAHPDFRVAGKIFATLPKPGNGVGTVMLPPDEQQRFIAAFPEAFQPVGGSWGVRGATYIQLRAAKPAVVRDALRSAWRNKAPKKLVRAFDDAR